MKGNFYDAAAVKKAIEKYCQSHNIDEYEFAEQIGVHPTSLSRIKSGKHCHPDNLQKIAYLCGKTLKDLIKPFPALAANEK